MDEEKKIQELIQQLGAKGYNILQQLETMGVSIKARDELIKVGKPAVHSLIEVLKDKKKKKQHYDAIVALGSIKDVSTISIFLHFLNDKRWSVTMAAASALRNIMKNSKRIEELENCKSIEDVENFEDNLTECFVKLRKKVKSKREERYLVSLTMRLKMKTADRKNKLAKEKGLLLPDKPKPPTKGKVFRQLERARNG